MHQSHPAQCKHLLKKLSEELFVLEELFTPPAARNGGIQ